MITRGYSLGQVVSAGLGCKGYKGSVRESISSAPANADDTRAPTFLVSLSDDEHLCWCNSSFAWTASTTPAGQMIPLRYIDVLKRHFYETSSDITRQCVILAEAGTILRSLLYGGG